MRSRNVMAKRKCIAFVLHISVVEHAGLSTFNEGDVIEFDIVANKDKESGENIKVK